MKQQKANSRLNVAMMKFLSVWKGLSGHSRTPGTCILKMILALLTVVPAGTWQGMAQTQEALTLTSRTNVAGGGGSFFPSFSGDGRLVLFVSFANNLATNDNVAEFMDVFIRDLSNHTTTLISLNAVGTGGGN